ncbi:MAG: tonB-system energizer ExbB [Pseudorhodobacter sp.]|nr:MAG: tonB-system energizer ExbB [Pseudorhodobacter sp.]
MSTAAVAQSAASELALTPLEMFRNADAVVQGVMIGLIIASVLVWAIWAMKLVQIGLSARSLRRALRQLQPGFTTEAPPGLTGTAAGMMEAARAERALGTRLPRDGVLDRAASELSALETATQRRLQAGVALIGTVAATAPFVGLFGTVWGIMNSFTGIAASKTTNLAVVAPGIAEALLATGIGLFAAIPALLFFNHLTRLLAAHRAMLAEVSRRIVSALSRDLDRAGAATPAERAQVLHLAGE